MVSTSTCAVLINNSKDDPYTAVTSINNKIISHMICHNATWPKNKIQTNKQTNRNVITEHNGWYHMLPTGTYIHVSKEWDVHIHTI